ncbi:peritrophin-44-like [Panulirus ornatus]|uniref:peritrophin-44-like n=1 Tax=Panulirus ornatus TaxID=150431 RepID=UPI003A840A62
MLLVFFVSLTMAVWGRAVSLEVSCTPTCQENDEPGTFVADPTNCQRYYVCLQGGHVSDFTEECEDGMLFDGDDRQCKPEAGNVTCHVCSPSCLLTCPADSMGPSLIADPSSCNKYYICIPGKDTIAQTCNDDTPFFNGDTCTASEAECCDLCTPFCSQAYTQIPDPANCTNFYFCGVEGIPDDSSLYHCATGNFDGKEGICKENAPCEEPCGTGSTGIYTPTPKPTTITKPPNTSTTTPTTTTTTTPTSGGALCYETFKCQEIGYFPKCLNRCDPHYYVCVLSDIGEYVEAEICSHQEVIHPDLVLCVSPEECPYPSTHHSYHDLL